MTERTPEELIKAFSEVNLLLGAIAENAAHIAHARKRLYDAHLAEGFSEERAFEASLRLTLT